MADTQITEKDILTDCWGANWKVLGIEDDVVYLECVSNWISPELVGESDICLLSDINQASSNGYGSKKHTDFKPRR